MVTQILRPTGQDGPNVKYWNYKIHAAISITYTLYNSSGANHTFTDERDAVSIAADAKMIIGHNLNYSESHYKLIADTIFVESNEMLINFTVWTNKRAYFMEIPDYITSNKFERALTSSATSYFVLVLHRAFTKMSVLLLDR